MKSINKMKDIGKAKRVTLALVYCRHRGGNAGKSWSQKLVRAMNKRDEQAKSASLLIERINKTKDLAQEFSK